MKTALVTGVLGQDGSYVAELLVEKGYRVTGVARPSGERRITNVKALLDTEDRDRKLQFHLRYGDITDPHLILQLVQQKFDEIYLLGGQTQVLQSFHDPTYTLRVNAESPLAFFEAVRQFSPNSRIYFAGTSEMFAGQWEGTKTTPAAPFEAHSPYAVAKASAFLAARLYRQLGLFIVGGIGFNHESRRRGANFVTRKIGLGLQEYKRSGRKVCLGNKDACRDWHHAKDTMNGAWLSLQHHSPGEYIFASGQTVSIERFAYDMCDVLNIGHPEKALVFGDDGERRPWEVPYLCGDPSETERVLGWKRAYSYEDLLLDVSAE